MNNFVTPEDRIMMIILIILSVIAIIIAFIYKAKSDNRKAKDFSISYDLLKSIIMDPVLNEKMILDIENRFKILTKLAKGNPAHIEMCEVLRSYYHNRFLVMGMYIRYDLLGKAYVVYQ